MRIGIDISSATPRRTGIGAYSHELARHLIADQANEFVLLFNSLRQPFPDTPEFRAPKVRIRKTRIPGPLILKSWQYFDRPSIERFSGPVDLFHSPSSYIPPQHTGARVTTVHDLDFLRPGAIVMPLGGQYLKWVFEKRLQNMDAVITVSSITAEEVQRNYGGTIAEVEGRVLSAGTNDAKGPMIHVVPLGVQETFFHPRSPAVVQSLRRRYDLADRFLLHVGTREPRKNIGMILRAYSRLVKENASVPQLVFAGAEGWDDSLNSIHELNLAERVRVLGYLKHEELPVLYQAATLLLLPSIMEGFGFPVVEAMASGVPVVCSRTVRCLEFLSPDSAMICDPENEQSLCESIRVVLSDAAIYDALIESGKRSARKLTWKACAEKTMQVYRLTLARKNSRAAAG